MKGKTMNYFFNRLSEPSTWSGLGVLVAILGVPASTFQLVQQVVMGVAGLVAVLKPDTAA